MSADRRLAAKELFLALCELPPAERQLRLAAVTAEDPALGADVASLLAFAHGGGDGAGVGDAEASGASPTTAPARGPGGPAAAGPPEGETAPTLATRMEPRGPGAPPAARPAPASAPSRRRRGEEPGSGDSRPETPRFGPGHVFAGRYRIVAELGRGGMGRVFRAQDLVLDEEVALKLLTGRSPGTVRRLVAEVRLARRVTHPNVCRVFDFGEAEGETFLTMEYVDGEDLRSLLSRIGRLPAEKLHEAAQQLCAGLAAIHAQGILHCDLKPGNVMVDGRGSVRISDFGLATATAADTAGGQLLGTPAYMAPELWAGSAPSVASDVYALGLVLHEMATGERLLRAGSPAAYRELHRDPPPTSGRLADADPRLEAVVRQCLEPAPAERPASVAAVAAALPAGDRLQLALLAGELPSADTVAGAAVPAARRARAAAAGVLAAALVTLLALCDRAFPGRTAWRDTPPETLVARAGELLGRLGHQLPVGHRAWGFQPDPLAADPEAVVLWYRQAADWMVPVDLDLQSTEMRVAYYDPPPLDEGMVQMLLAPRGELVTLKVLPAGFAGGSRAEPAPGEAAWAVLLAATGIPPGAAEEVPPRTLPPVFADRRRAWEQPAGAGERPLRLEAAALGGRIVFADVAPAGDDPEGAVEPLAALVEWTTAADAVLWLVVGVAALVMARGQLRDGRSDRLGARRIALFVAGVSLLRWALGSDHVPLLEDELARLVAASGRALAEGLLAWLAYAALEPIARRFWPRSLVAWSRLLRGRVADPAVGDSLLLGAAAGALVALVGVLDRVLVRALGLTATADVYVPWQLEAALGARRWLSAALAPVVDGVYWAVLGLFLLAVLRRLLGGAQPTIAVWVVLFGAYGLVAGAHPAVSWATVGLATAALGALVLVRAGLLAWAVALAVGDLLLSLPVTLDLAAWYGEAGAFAVLAIAALGVVGWWWSRAGQPAARRAEAAAA